VITHDRDDGELNGLKAQLRCRIVTITTNPTMTRAIPAAYSFAVESVNRDAGTLINRMVAAMNATVIATLIHSFRRRLSVPTRNQLELSKPAPQVAENNQ